MKISKIQLTNFKRFTDLLIDNIPSSSKLVLLIGSNGSGKSSVFDSFGFIDAAIKKDVKLDEAFLSYFTKKSDLELTVSIKLDDKVEHTIRTKGPTMLELNDTAFYGRTSFRQIPRLTRTTLGQGGNVDFQ